jgi:hypothetical protein
LTRLIPAFWLRLLALMQQETGLKTIEIPRLHLLRLAENHDLAVIVNHCEVKLQGSLGVSNRTRWG